MNSSISCPTFSSCSLDTGNQSGATCSGAEASGEDVEEGITYRWGVKRPGRDRWHNPDGSLIDRGRGRPPQPGPALLEVVPGLAPVPEDDLIDGPDQGPPFAVTGLNPDAPSPALKCVTFYGREFLVRSNKDTESGESTTAGEESDDVDHESLDTSSSESQVSSEGFWKQGQWQARPPRRSQRRMERMQTYFRGEWKPRWLEEYISQKKDRDAQREQGEKSGLAVGQDTSPLTSSSVTPFVDEDPLEQTADPDQWEDWEWGFQQEDGGTSSWWASWSSSSPSWSSWSSPSAWWNSETTSWDWQGGEPTEEEVLEEWPWPGEASSSTSTSTTTTSGLVPHLPHLPPNSGLFPEVRELGVSAGEEMEETWLMQLTNSERALLSESGVPTATVNRMETLLDTMERQQQEGRGAEGRWALGCFLSRAAGGLEALDRVVGVLQRRLQPRGYWPVRRVPRSEQMRWQLFQWGRNQRDLLLGVFERHLDVGMVPDDTNLEAGEGHIGGEPEASSPASLVATEAAPSTPGERDSITPTTSAREGFGRDTQASSSEGTSDRALNSEGELVSVPSVAEDPNLSPRGPPPPLPVVTGTFESALAGGIHGVWVDPEDPHVASGDVASSSSSDSSASRESESAADSRLAARSTLTSTSSLTMSTTSDASLGSVTCPTLVEEVVSLSSSAVWTPTSMSSSASWTAMTSSTGTTFSSTSSGDRTLR